MRKSFVMAERKCFSSKKKVYKRNGFWYFVSGNVNIGVSLRRSVLLALMSHNAGESTRHILHNTLLTAVTQNSILIYITFITHQSDTEVDNILITNHTLTTLLSAVQIEGHHHHHHRAGHQCWWTVTCLKIPCYATDFEGAVCLLTYIFSANRIILCNWSWLTPVIWIRLYMLE